MAAMYTARIANRLRSVALVRARALGRQLPVVVFDDLLRDWRAELASDIGLLPRRPWRVSHARKREAGLAAIDAVDLLHYVILEFVKRLQRCPDGLGDRCPMII